MNNFEKQLAASARRLREQDERHLNVPPVGRERRIRPWMATAAAAVAGLLIGLSIPRTSSHRADTPSVLAADTIGQNITSDGANYSLFVSL